MTINSIGSMYQTFFTKEIVKKYSEAKTSNIRKFNELFNSLLYNNGILFHHLNMKLVLSQTATAKKMLKKQSKLMMKP